MSRRYLVTGGAGFIGSNFIRYLLENEPEARITNLDLLTYAGVMANIADLDAYPNHHFVKGDIRDEDFVDSILQGHEIVINFAAETHVDRSIASPRPFLDTNILGTSVLLEAARRHEAPTFIQVSTDEVYGSIPTGSAEESARLSPSSPYAASKAGADLLARSYATTFEYRPIITRCTNNYGPRQLPEKVIPLFVTNLLDGKKVPLYGDGANERDWLHVEDHCSAIHLLIDSGTPGEVYNIGADAQIANRDLTTRILDLMGKDESWIEYVSDRKGHDFRYAVNSEKVRALGWYPRFSIEDRLEETIAWYRLNESWWKPLKERLL